MSIRDTTRSGGRQARHVRSLAATILCGLAASAAPAAAQWSAVYSTAALPGGFNWAFRDRFPDAAGLINSSRVAQSVAHRVLLRSSNPSPAELDSAQLGAVLRVLADPPRLVSDDVPTTEITRLAPEIAAMFDWVQTLRRQTYDVWADPSLSPDARDARLTELLGHYRSRPDLAFSGIPRSPDLTDAQLYSLAFRRRFPAFNGVLWTTQWLESGLLEALLTAPDEASRREAAASVMGRVERMFQAPAVAAPYLMPLTPAIAPTFTARYPSLAATFDNARMMEGIVLDILASREIPRSARRTEMLAAAAWLRSDSASAISYEAWFNAGETIGVANMGGPAIGFGPELARPTVARGASLAGMIPPGMDVMPAMQHAAAQDTGALRAVYDRMMADPVIRERAATDPMLQQLMRDAGLALPSPGGAMPGMNHGNMAGGPGNNMAGMQHGAANMPPSATGTAGLASMLDPAASPEDRRRAVEFIVRLFADPAVEARIHADPELHRLWSDPDVQRRLAELRANRTPTPTPTAPRATPAPRPVPATPPAHQHP